MVLVMNNNLYVNIITYNRYITTTNDNIILVFSDFYKDNFTIFF